MEFDWNRFDELRLGVDHYIGAAGDELLSGTPVRAYKLLDQAGSYWGELNTMIISLQEQHEKESK